MKSMQLLVILLLISFILFLILHLDFDTQEGFDPEVPECEGDVGSYVPGCYATVQKDDYLSYPEFASDDYILKTKIVTPVCPNDPYARMGNESILPKDPPKDPSNDISSNPVPSNQPTPSNNASIQLPAMPTLSDSYLLTPTPEKPPEPTPACKEEVKSSPDTCPPCPACERCPEPVVDCKKVVHYKDQQYPVPLIADFSQFSRF